MIVPMVSDSASAVRCRALRNKKDAAGLCVKCGGVRDRLFRKICTTCEEKQSKWKKKGRKKRAPKEKMYHETRWADRMIVHSKISDKKMKRAFEEDEYITHEFLVSLRENANNECIYCDIRLQSFNRKRFNGVTVQRLDNSKAHIKSNCVLACYKCNMSRVEDERLITMQKLKARKTWNLIAFIIRNL